MSYVPVSWSYKDAITVNKTTQMVDNTLAVCQNRIIGGELRVEGSSTAVINGGYLWLEDNWLQLTAAETIQVTAAANWITGTVAEAASTAIYIYAINSASQQWQAKFSLSAPAYSDCNSGTSTGPEIYDYITGLGKWARCIGMVVNNTGSDFKKQYQAGNNVYYYHGPIIKSNGTATYTPLDLSAVYGDTCWLPKYSESVQIHFDNKSAGGSLFYIKSNIHGDSGTIQFPDGNAESTLSIPIGTARNYEWRSNSDAYPYDQWLISYDNAAVRGN